MGAHIVNGSFQSDKYPGCPAGKVPLSVKDTTAQDLLWAYASRRRKVDAEFAADLETCLMAAGYCPIPAEKDGAKIDIGALRKLLAATTPGPWAWEATSRDDNEWQLGLTDPPVKGQVIEKHDARTGTFEALPEVVEHVASSGAANSFADAEFIVAARNGLHGVLNELEAGRTRIVELEAALLEAAAMPMHWSSRAKQAKFRQLVTGEAPIVKTKKTKAAR